ncbi:MAG: hypothetical protein AVDCRST_MAG47-1085 [uncultured Nocardioidaceae bacterium]|uniref:Uncharacterized protein n=1 Tax=uncultured Nocardioidaceae bacterium TaxID=253824 RepID=A0A6J4MV73_9ACTN|nr:MAG: hypothetical protein AVDCRST_MAG47-1085 [uncultured Nocardioidaceae bacterium]
MWGTLATFVLGILGTAASANLLAGRGERTRKQLREEADLLEHLPADLPGRSRFVEQLSLNVWTYVEHQRDLQYRKLRARYRAALLSLMALTTVGIAAMFWTLEWVDTLTDQHAWAAAGFVAMALSVAGFAAAVGRRLRAHILSTEPDAHAIPLAGVPPMSQSAA